MDRKEEELGEKARKERTEWREKTRKRRRRSGGKETLFGHVTLSCSTVKFGGSNSWPSFLSGFETAILTFHSNSEVNDVITLP